MGGLVTVAIAMVPTMASRLVLVGVNIYPSNKVNLKLKPNLASN